MNRVHKSLGISFWHSAVIPVQAMSPKIEMKRPSPVTITTARQKQNMKFARLVTNKVRIDEKKPRCVDGRRRWGKLTV